MLPFTLKTVEEPILRLHLHNSENSIMDVDIFNELDTHPADFAQQDQFYTSIHDQNRSELRRVHEATYQAFATFLHEISVQSTFLPTDLLTQFPNQRYFLILSIPRIYELQEVLQSDPEILWMNRGQSLFEYEGFEIILSSKHHLCDNTAFLVSSGKYTVFIRQENGEDITRFYRSQFYDLIGNAPPPLHFNAPQVIDTIQDGLSRPDSITEIEHTRLIHSDSDNSADVTDNLKCCPVCNGELRRIMENAFCLECDWDNLPPLKRYTTYQ